MRQEGGRKPQDADYGLGEHTIDGAALGLIDEQELTDRLLQTFESEDYRPPRLPAVALDLLALSKQPEVEFSELETLLEQDAMMAGEVLSLARSAFYSGARPVGSLRDALVRLGLDKLQQVVLQATMNLRVFKSTTYRGCMERLRRHCRATAHMSRIVSRYSPVEEEQAFLCGLLHDVGIAGILLMLGDVQRGQQAPDLAVLWPAIDRAHAKAGARMVHLWDLPVEVSMVVGAHHEVSIGGYDHPVAATVCIAETLAADFDMAFVPHGPGADAPDASGLATHGRIDCTDASVLARARAALQITDTTMKLIKDAAGDWVHHADAEPAGA